MIFLCSPCALWCVIVRLTAANTATSGIVTVSKRAIFAMLPSILP